ncbi:MAG TPA: hypothetical protein VI197_14555 [Polyangiaceae bacterium]
MIELRRPYFGAPASALGFILLSVVSARAQVAPDAPPAPPDVADAGDDVDIEVGADAPAAPPPAEPLPIAPETAPAAPAESGQAPPVSAAAAPDAVVGAAPEAPELDAEPTNEGAEPASAPGPGREVPAQTRRGYFRPVGRGLEQGGYLQAQYEWSQLSEDELLQGEPVNQDGFVLRRARLRIDHGSQFTAATLEFDANTVNGLKVGVRRAEGALIWRAPDDTAAPWAMLSAGVTDIPFGAEIVESPRHRVFMERSLGSRALFPTEADVGAKLSLAYGPFAAAVAVMNGEPLDGRTFPTDPNSAKDVIGHVAVAAPIGAGIVIEGGASLATGKGFHPGSPASKDDLVWVDENNDGVAQSTELRGVQGRAATASENFDRDAVGVDLRLTVPTPIGETQIFAEGFVANNYDRGLLVADPVLSGLDVRQVGASASLSQQVTQWGYVGFRAAYYDPNSDLFEQRKGRILPVSQEIWTFSPVVGASIEAARVSVQYDFVQDSLARDEQGVPTDADNDQLTARLEVGW